MKESFEEKKKRLALWNKRAGFTFKVFLFSLVLTVFGIGLSTGLTVAKALYKADITWFIATLFFYLPLIFSILMFLIYKLSLHQSRNIKFSKEEKEMMKEDAKRFFHKFGNEISEEDLKNLDLEDLEKLKEFTDLDDSLSDKEDKDKKDKDDKE